MLYVVEEHHQILVHWQRIAHVCGEAPFVLSLDHHADVLAAFSGGGRADWLCPVDQAVALLRHDEHFDYAVKSGIISGASIIVHDNFTEAADERLELCRDPEWPDTQVMLNDAEAYRPFADGMLESDFLKRWWLRYLDGRKLILDIDLDVFATARSCMPRDTAFLYELLRRVEAVTVSRERDWVRLLRLPGEEIDDVFLLDCIQKHMSQAH